MSEDDLNAIAWRDFMQFALHDEAMRAEFTATTGREFRDSAAYVVAFVKWATMNHYGIEYAPKTYRNALEANKQ